MQVSIADGGFVVVVVSAIYNMYVVEEGRAGGVSWWNGAAFALAYEVDACLRFEAAGSSKIEIMAACTFP